MDARPDERRHLGLFGATLVGVGAIVGGGILALAGVAFATAGPAALVAFAANGVIAVLTALAFAEMSARFPESGGTYTFAKKVLSVEAAFMVGWIVWFASIVAAVLYALGFASFAQQVVIRLATSGGATLPTWFVGRPGGLMLALAATAVYTAALVRRSAGGGRYETLGKVVVFVVLIAGGVWFLLGSPEGTTRAGMLPFAPFGLFSIVQAMGYSFIALQGFDLIAAVGGLSCLGLAIFQGVAVPVAGILAVAWLGLGFLLFASLFAARARVFDASSEAQDPQLVKLRGRHPLVLVPVANPQRAEALVEVANALAPPNVGRVLMLSVVQPPEIWKPGEPLAQVAAAQAILEQALTVSLATNHAPEALTTIAAEVPREIAAMADDEAPGSATARVEEATDPVEAMCERACEVDLVVLGLKRLSRQQKVLGSWVIRLARETDCGLIMISRRG